MPNYYPIFNSAGKRVFNSSGAPVFGYVRSGSVSFAISFTGANTNTEGYKPSPKYATVTSNVTLARTAYSAFTGFNPGASGWVRSSAVYLGKDSVYNYDWYQSVTIEKVLVGYSGGFSLTVRCGIYRGYMYSGSITWSDGGAHDFSCSKSSAVYLPDGNYAVTAGHWTPVWGDGTLSTPVSATFNES